MVPDEPLDAAFADAVALGQIALGRTRAEGRDEQFRIGLAEPVTDPPLTGRLGRTNAEHWFPGLPLCLLKLPYRADQRVREVQTF